MIISFVITSMTFAPTLSFLKILRKSLNEYYTSPLSSLLRMIRSP